MFEFFRDSGRIENSKLACNLGSEELYSCPSYPLNELSLSERLRLALFLTVLVFLFLSINIASAFALADGPSFSKYTVPNILYAGYGDIVPTPYNINAVYTSFIQPKINCDASEPGGEEVMFLAGLDGYNVSTIHYVGTEIDCPPGSSTPTYSALSSGVGTIPSLVISPGDIIFGNITVVGGTIVYTLADITKGTSGTDTGSAPDQGVNDAKCVISSVIEPTGEALAIPKFATAKIGEDYTTIAPTCVVSIRGLPTNAIGNPPVGYLFKYVMYNVAMTAIRASPSGLTSSKTSFKVHWVSAGP